MDDNLELAHQQDAAPVPQPASRLWGNFDGVHGRWVDGWAFDAAAPSRVIVVEIFDGQRLLGESPARLFRGDLASAAIGEGDHAFKFLLPLELFDGQDHLVSVRVQGSETPLTGSPVRLKTAPLTGAAAFPSSPELAAVTPPLSDVQFTMLRSLHALTDTLVAQTRTLNLLLERLQPAAQAGPQAATLPDPGDGWVSAVGACPPGEHDFIVFSIINWNFRIQRPQHLATQIAAMGNRVFYLSISFEPTRPGWRRFAVRSCPAPGVFEVVLRCTPPAPSIYAGIDDPARVQELSAALADMVTELRLKSPVGIM